MQNIELTHNNMTFQEPVEFDYSISARKMQCHFCNEIFEIKDVNPGEQVKCPRCAETNIRIEKNPILIPILYATLALFAFFLSLTFPLIGIKTHIINYTHSTSIISMFSAMQGSGHVFLAFVFLFFVLITPPIFIVSTLYVYISIAIKRLLPGVHAIAYIMTSLRPWIMVDIFFIAIVVSLVKIHVLASIEFGYTLITLMGYSIFIARMVLAISEYWVEEKLLNIENKTMPFRDLSFAEIQEASKVKIQLAWALLLTALIFYIPANFFSMMVTDGLGFYYESTILEGVIQIWTSGDYFVASIIFLASFIIPIAKLFILFIILFSIKYQRILSSKKLTKLHVFIERIGRWSMIDVFVIMLMISLFNSRLVSIFPGEAVMYFCMVVNLTMVATGILDSKLLWVGHTSAKKINV